ncbi:eukaryotic translation initiation factor 2-alpha kinase 1, partial [Trichonephila clavata]
NNGPDLQKIKTDSTFLLHILIETLCCLLEKEDDKRQQLFECICSSLTKQKYLDPMVYETLAPIRREYASKFYEHIRKVHSTLAPSSLLQGAYSELADSLVIQKTYIKYKDMFNEIQIIGKGGFGIVCKARHKVDNMVYAVKKIIFTYRNDSDYNKVMREVKSFAGLSHMNVVGYNNAWVQTVEQLSETLTESSSTSYSSSDDSDPVDFLRSSTPLRRDFNRYSESDSILFYASTTQEVDSSDSSFEDSTLDEELVGINPKLDVKMMLCIQMEFCDCDLRNWLDARNAGKQLPFQKKVADIFKEILSGVAYIHSKSVIHRDLKPQNIFFSIKDCMVKVGDFGLATLGHPNPDSSLAVSRHSTNLGTKPYAAPEQIHKSHYDSKVDMYSLGIILIELLLQFKTAAEFSRILDQMKSGKIPEELNKDWPEFVPLVQNLVQEEPKLRMNAKEVLNMPLLQGNHVEEINALWIKVKDLENELSQKEQQFQQLVEEVKTLRLKLSEQN